MRVAWFLGALCVLGGCFRLAAADFVGTWNIGEPHPPGGRPFVMTLNADFTARKSHVPNSRGKWSIVNGEVRVIWSEGWRDIGVRIGGGGGGEGLGSQGEGEGGGGARIAEGAGEGAGPIEEPTALRAVRGPVEAIEGGLGEEHVAAGPRRRLDRRSAGETLDPLERGAGVHRIRIDVGALDPRGEEDPRDRAAPRGGVPPPAAEATAASPARPP